MKHGHLREFKKKKFRGLRFVYCRIKKKVIDFVRDSKRINNQEKNV